MFSKVVVSIFTDEALAPGKSLDPKPASFSLGFSLTLTKVKTLCMWKYSESE
jgi:hypothetical protein